MINEICLTCSLQKQETVRGTLPGVGVWENITRKGNQLHFLRKLKKEFLKHFNQKFGFLSFNCFLFYYTQK